MREVQGRQVQGRRFDLFAQVMALPLLIVLSLPANATSFEVTQLLTFGSGGGASHLQTTTGSFNQGTAVTSRVADIASATGSYTIDEMGLGTLLLELTTEAGEVFTLSGDGFNFGYNPDYDPDPMAQFVLLDPVIAQLQLPEGGIAADHSNNVSAPGGLYNVSFLAQLMNGTNTLSPADEYDVPTLVLALWGSGRHESIGQRRAGIDIRVELTPTVVPAPAAFILFGTALLGLMGIRKPVTQSV